MSSVNTGRRAEQAAAEYLTRAGYEILEQNYRRRSCEIDIVARCDDVIFFVEVKYRADNHFGGGLDYIASQKLRHMRRGAQTWVSERLWRGEYCLAAVEVEGPDFEVMEIIDSIT